MNQTYKFTRIQHEDVCIENKAKQLYRIKNQALQGRQNSWQDSNKFFASSSKDRYEKLYNTLDLRPEDKESLNQQIVTDSYDELQRAWYNRPTTGEPGTKDRTDKKK